MQLGAVCDRTIDGEVYSFGTSGYTMNNVFVLYDRNTDSVWYPLSDDTFDAVSGPDKGKTLNFIAKPEVMRLHEWAARHPETLVLIPPPPTPEQQRMLDRRERLRFRREIPGGQMIDSVGEVKHALFKTPAFDEWFKPWFDFKADLDEKYGLRFGVSFTHLYQWASDTVGTENDGSGFELVLDGTWTFLGRGTDSPTMAGFEILYRDRLGTDIPPVALFTQIGSLYPTTVAFGDLSPSIGQFWIQQKFENGFEFQIGKLYPVAAYDFFPLKNFRTDFLDGVQGVNIIIPLPDRGLGGFVMYRPQPDSYLRLGVHDANADAESSGFSSMFDDGELFTIFEAGFDPGLMERQPGRPPLR